MAWTGQFLDLQVSLHGARIGIDKDDYLRTRGLKETITVIGSSGATAPRDEVTTLSSSSGTFTLEAPMTGVRKTITSISTSTLIRQLVTPTAVFFNTTGGSTLATVNFNGQAQTMTMIGLSTSLWGVLTNNGSSFQST
jgi:hypothetical protein